MTATMRVFYILAGIAITAETIWGFSLLWRVIK
jgi:nitrogen fixation-related uncharacterized protein